MNDISYNNWKSMSDNHIALQIGEFVKYHRIRQNKNQTMLAQEACISRSTLSLLERGHVVTLITLIRVLRILNQLQVFDSFAINCQPSLLELAKAERNQRQRVVPKRNKKKPVRKHHNW